MSSLNNAFLTDLVGSMEKNKAKQVLIYIISWSFFFPPQATVSCENIKLYLLSQSTLFLIPLLQGSFAFLKCYLCFLQGVRKWLYVYVCACARVTVCNHKDNPDRKMYD